MHHGILHLKLHRHRRPYGGGSYSISILAGSDPSILTSALAPHILILPAGSRGERRKHAAIALIADLMHHAGYTRWIAHGDDLIDLIGCGG